MRQGLIVLWMVLCSVTSAVAQVSIGIGLPHVSIGINLPLYPELVPVPGYPVYYAPPPVYFRGWRPDAPPRWGEHWGRGWEQRRAGWDRWNRGSVPRPAPLPVYQRQYSGDRYPRLEQQHALHSQQYRYQPRDTVVRQHYREQAARSAPAQRGNQGAIQQRSDRQPGAAAQRAPMSQGQEHRPEGRASQEPPRGQGQGEGLGQGQGQRQGKGRGDDEERGRERNR